MLVEESQEAIKNLKLPKSIFSYPKVLDIRHIDWDNDIEKLQKKNLVNISRISFDYWLLRLCGPKLQFLSNTKFISMEQNSKAVKVLLERGNKKIIVKAKYLVGADGGLSSVRRNLGKNSIRKYFAVQEFLKLAERDIKDALFIYDNEITDFYSWVIPKGNNLIIGTAIPNKLQERFKLFKEKLRKNLGITGHVAKKEAAVIIRPKSRKDVYLGKSRIMLVGEAAGFISPSTGEGISFALRSGTTCGQALVENFKNPLKSYTKSSKPLIEEIKSKIKKAEILSDPLKRKQFLASIRR